MAYVRASGRSRSKASRARRRAAKGAQKEQGAIEYLMTYGWTVLIIALVLATFFALGIFSISAPRAQPGSCIVYRPAGPFTSTLANTEGICSNLLPQFVAYMNGRSSYLNLSKSYQAYTPGGFTLSVWFSPSGGAGATAPLFFGGTGNGAVQLNYNPSFQLNFSPGCGKNLQTINLSQGSTWDNVVLSIVPLNPFTNVTLYINGVIASSVVVTCNINATKNLIFGHGNSKKSNYFSGYISNIQLYNNTLSPADASKFYADGVGGVPYDLRALLGWWPLNSNTNDYSGNNNPALQADVAYRSSYPT